MTKIYYFNFLARIKFNLNKSIILVGDFANWSKFEDDQVKYLNEIAENNNVEKSILVFKNSLFNESLLNSDNIIEKAKKYKINNVIFYEYNSKYKEFLISDLYNNLVSQVNASKFIIANNYNIDVFNTVFFTKNDKQNTLIYKDFNLKEEDYSSIKLIENNKFEEFKVLNDFSYKFDGIVEKGKQLGRKIGFPTINIVIKNKKLILNHGIFACKVYIESLKKEFAGAGCYWKNELNQEVFEVNIFDFNKEIYDWKVTITPIKWIRENKKVNSLEELIELLKKDVDNCKKIIILE
ncbi:riboflavin kinase/FAD synthetase [Spiroplasma litorale]|uniref:riboflavin kinase n=1 Tax=Spiroplasma litorale TaxID=216942 RepID=A0A0K1W1E1_9MOLU|nr:riboflavin kinase [Spiroplasma litorale]AKX34140.1 riboflavin kinase/FAD synthetase [Spiroplasma litorale]